MGHEPETSAPPRFMTESAFFTRCAALLPDGPVPIDELSPGSIWEVGFDSASIVEVVLLVEDLGGALPDDLPWESITLSQVYQLYFSSLMDDPPGATAAGAR